MIDPDAFPRPFCDLGAWAWLEAKAGTERRLETSLRSLADAWGWNHMRVKRTLQKWAESGHLVTASAKSVTHLSLSNSLLDRGPLLQQRPKPVTPKTDLLGQPEGPKRKRRTAITEEWTFPPEWGRWAVDEMGLTREEAWRQAVGFKDFWLMQGELKADWRAAWRLRIRNYVARKQQNSGASEGALEEMKAKYPDFNRR